MRRYVTAGQVFGRWTVLEYAAQMSVKTGGKTQNFKVNCRCECGTERQVYIKSLVYEESRSCGCLQAELARGNEWRRTHGFMRHPLYNRWLLMVSRCTKPSNSAYPDYGGRGITVCERWQGREGIGNFIADMGGCPPGMSLDRIDNDGNYEPGNCRWATPAEQNKNQRKRITGSRRLLAENQALKRDLTALEAENAQLRRRIGELLPWQRCER